MQYQNISVVAFDGDDTLWVNEPIYQSFEKDLVRMLSRYVGPKIAREKLFAINTSNLGMFGYGVKGFVLSMIETAIEISRGEIPAAEIQKILAMGKQMLEHPVEVIEGVEEVLHQLSSSYHLMLVTKGDLIDQESKISRSGLAGYFKNIEILSEKNENSYELLLDKHRLPRNEFLMVGNSVKSDILPVVNIGGNAAHIPFHTTWGHEHVDEMHLKDKYFLQLKHASELLTFLSV